MDNKKPRPVPKPSSYTKPFWDGAREKKLMLQYDPEAKAFQFWPRPTGIKSGKANLEWRESAGKGVLYSYTLVHVPAPGFHCSASSTPLASLKPDFSLSPPVASTVPSGSEVRLTKLRANAMLLVGCQVGFGWLMSRVKAVRADGPESPLSAAEPAFMKRLGA